MHRSLMKFGPVNFKASQAPLKNNAPFRLKGGGKWHLNLKNAAFFEKALFFRRELRMEAATKSMAA